MSTQILPVGEIILTNQRGLIGAGYDYQLRSGPDGTFTFDTGSFGLTGNADDRKLRFDHCFIIVPESIPWFPSADDLLNLFRFTLVRDSDGFVVSDTHKNLFGDLKYVFHDMVHYVEGHSDLYNIPARLQDMPDGNYTLTVSVDQYRVICPPAFFYLGVQGENSWMTKAPSGPALKLVPFVEGTVTREMLNPAAPPPKPT